MLIALVMAAAGALYWWRSGGDETAIRERLKQLAADINAPSGAPATGGLDALARAARIGDAFTDDVLIDLGRGASPIQGRGLVIDMAARLQPRAAQYRLEFSDVTVTLTGPETADVSLTATSRSRSDADDIVDAREFAAAMTKTGNDWRIARVTAVSPLRRD